MAFNDISQGARDWNDGQLPDQLTQHTELSDGRTAGFLHLRVRSDQTHSPIDFLLPDLSGEWSKSMVDQNRTDRLQFLKRADVIWLILDGSQLNEPTKRLWAVHRMNILLERVVHCVDVPPKIVLVLTRRDQSEVPHEAFDPLLQEAKHMGVDLSVVQIASFAAPDCPVAAGFGISNLIETSQSVVHEFAATWPLSPLPDSLKRSVLRYRVPEQQT